MPTILRFRNFRVMIFTDDYPPAHVHVIGPDGIATFFLRCPQGSVVLRSRHGIDQAQKTAIAIFLNQHLELLCKAWEEIHGV